MENSRLLLDRARRVLLGTGLERLERIPERIWEGFSRQKAVFWSFCTNALGCERSKATAG